MAHFIELNSPAELHTESTLSKITDLIKSGLRTYQIQLILKFVAPDDTICKISDDFRRIKNQISFNEKNTI